MWLLNRSHTRTLYKEAFRTLAAKFKAPLRIISRFQEVYLQLMEMVITNKVMGSYQTEISEEGCWDLWGYGVSPLSPICAISESKCSSFIYYSICFTPLFLFLFSRTPFSLSPLGGAIFIFGVSIFPLLIWRGPFISLWPFNMESPGWQHTPVL